MADYAYYQTVTQSGNITLPAGKYRIHVIGKGGDGAAGGAVQAHNAPRGAAGGASGSTGAYAIHEVSFAEAQSIVVEVSLAQTSIILPSSVKVTANAGVNGFSGGLVSGGSPASVQGVIASGGNVANIGGVSGIKGGDGTTSETYFKFRPEDTTSYSVMAGAKGADAPANTNALATYTPKTGVPGGSGAISSDDFHFNATRGSDAVSDAKNLGGAASAGGGVGGVVIEKLPNSPPSPPSGITVPDTVNGGAGLTISWSASSDPDNNLVGYKLERSVNGAAWIQIYQANTLSYTDSITFGWSTVQYRVRAYDSYDEHSGYTTGLARSVFNNRAPGAPPSITVPTIVNAGENLIVSWGAATDADGNLSGYVLERSVDSGGWSQIYKGANQSYGDSVQSAWSTVAYRVKAYDSYNVESGYVASAVRNVNTAPTISGSNSSLGEKNSGFVQSYTVSSRDSGAISVTESLDGTVIRTFSAASGSNYEFQITGERYQTVLNGSHVMEVMASGTTGLSTVRSWSFTKNIASLSITMNEAIQSEGMPTVCTVSITRVVPAASDFKVEVCNNANDDSPSWEDMTSFMINSRKYYFVNDEKTAESWAFNVRITISRGTGSGVCYVAGIGGNFQ